MQWPAAAGRELRLVTLVAAAVLALGACRREQPAAAAPRAVVAAAVHADAAAAHIALPASVQARYSTPLSFRIAGKLIERRVRLGDAVQAGETLAKLDPTDIQANLDSAQAQLAAARHRAGYARSQLERDTGQAHEGLITTAQLEQTQDAYTSSVAQSDQATQQVTLARNQLRYTALVAGHDGVITAEDAETGQNVSAGQSIYEIAWSGALDIISNVAESRLVSLPVGRAVDVRLAAQPDRHYTARVREIAPVADPQSHTYLVKMTLDDPDTAVHLGMTATISLDAQQPAGTMTIPATALFHSGTAPAVWIVRADDTLELRRVKIARYGPLSVDVAAGLRDGERVVLQGVHTIGPNEKVRIVAPLTAEADES